MSFIGDVNEGVTFNAGSFLANGDENVVRETREASAESELVVTSADGTKHIPAGTAYPSNDGNAEGILYEDTDVTLGNMPCSVITGNATVYKDRLAVTGVSYDAVSPVGTENPKALGWYVSDGEGGYVLTTDTTVQGGTTYYEKVCATISVSCQAALEAKGLKFIASAPAVTRPY